MRVNSQAFTLIECVFTLALASIILLMVVPSFQSLLQRNQTQVFAERLITAIHLSRNLAIKYAEPVIFCGSSDHQDCDGHWNEGQIIKNLHTGKIFYNYPKLTPGGNLIWQSSLGKNDAIQFEPTGFTGQQGRFYFSYQASSASIIVLRTGRIRIAD